MKVESEVYLNRLLVTSTNLFYRSKENGHERSLVMFPSGGAMHLKLYDYTGFDFDGATTTVGGLGNFGNFGNFVAGARNKMSTTPVLDGATSAT